jgi:hypothetical protein
VKNLVIFVFTDFITTNGSRAQQYQDLVQPQWSGAGFNVLLDFVSILN